MAIDSIDSIKRIQKAGTRRAKHSDLIWGISSLHQIHDYIIQMRTAWTVRIIFFVLNQFSAEAVSSAALSASSEVVSAPSSAALFSDSVASAASAPVSTVSSPASFTESSV